MKHLFSFLLIMANLIVFSQATIYSPASIVVGQDTGCGIKSYIPTQNCDPPVDPWQGGSSSCRIDLDGDGVIDITTSYGMSSVAMQGYSYHSSGLSTRDSCFICVQATNQGLADSLKPGDIVDSSRTWGRSVDLGSSSWSMGGSSTSSGYQPAYYGVKMKKGNTITYGWYHGSVYAVTSVCVTNLQDTTIHVAHHHIQKDTTHNLQNNNSSGELKLYPNPADDILIVQADTSVQVSVIISDLTGRLVVNTTMINQKGIDIKYLPYGVYIVELKTSSKAARQKLVVYH